MTNKSPSPFLRYLHAGLFTILFGFRVADGRDVVLWDGEKHREGSGWVSPEGDPNLMVRVQEHQSHSPTHAVMFHFKARHLWAECAWRWFPWVPPAAGSDFRPYRAIRFALKVTTPFPSDDLHVRLDSAPDGAKSRMLSLKSYASSFADGRWHLITIPLADFNQPGIAYDPAHAVELFFGTWLDDGTFEIYLDDISLIARSTL